MSSFLFNSTRTTLSPQYSLKVCSQTCFQCCLKFHQQRKTAGLGVRQISRHGLILSWAGLDPPGRVLPAAARPAPGPAGTAPRGRPRHPPAGRTPTRRPLRSHRPAARTPARGPRLSTPSAQEGGHWGNSAGGPGAHAIGRLLTNEVAAARRPHPRAPSATRRPPLSACKQEARSF